MKYAIVETYNNEKKTVTLCLQHTESKVNREGKVLRRIYRSNSRTFKTGSKKSIAAYKEQLNAIMQAESPKTHQERKYL